MKKIITEEMKIEQKRGGKNTGTKNQLNLKKVNQQSKVFQPYKLYFVFYRDEEQEKVKTIKSSSKKSISKNEGGWRLEIEYQKIDYQ